MLLLLNGQHRIIAHLCRGISLVICNLQSRGTYGGSFLHGLSGISLDKSVQSSLSKQICFHLFCGSLLAICRTTIHPVYSVDTLLAASGLLHLLKFLDLAFFGALLEDLVDLFALIEGFLLFFPDALLVGHEHGVP